MANESSLDLPRSVGWALLASACVAFCPLVVVADDEIVIPGGAPAVARILDLAPGDPSGLLVNINRALLTDIRSGHDIVGNHLRSRLVAYLQTLGQLEATFEFPLTFDGRDGESVREFQVLAGAVGLRPVDRQNPLLFESVEGEEAEHRQRAVRAIGWDLLKAARLLREGEPVTLELTHGSAISPVPAEMLSAATRRRITSTNMLVALAADQRLGLLFDGWLRLTADSRAALGPETLHRLYSRAPFAFYRYSSGIRFEGDRLLVPGGKGAAPAWRDWVGASPDDAVPFVEALFVGPDRGAVALWSALSHLPKDHALPFVRRLERYGAPSGLASFASETTAARTLRALPTAPPLLSLVGLSDAVAALETDPPGASAEAWCQDFGKRGRSERKGRESDCLGRLLAQRRVYRGFDRPAVEAFAGLESFLSTVPAASDPQTKLALIRLSRGAPRALESLGRIRPVNPDSVRGLVQWIARVARRPDGAQDRLLAHLQGGLELLAFVAESEAIDPSAVNGFFDRWVGIHLEPGGGLARLAFSQSVWLVDLLDAVGRHDDAEGRGPREKAWLGVLGGVHGSEAFSWRGLRLGANRRQRRTARMVEVLRANDIAPLDDHLALVVALRDLESNPASAKAPGSVRELRERLDALGEPLPVAASERTTDWTGNRLGSLKARLGRHLSPYLIANGYLPVIADLEGFRLADQRLLRRHRSYPVAAKGAFIDGLSAWRAARPLRRTATGRPLHVAGHLGTAGEVVLALHLQSQMTEPSGKTGRSEVWARAASRTHALSASVEEAALVARLMDFGLEQARDSAAAPVDDHLRRRIERIVPPARLERIASAPYLASPSDRLRVALALAESGEMPESLHTAVQRAGRLKGLVDRLGLSAYPYEGLEREVASEVMAQREWPDVALTVVAYAGRKGLSPSVQLDLIEFMTGPGARSIPRTNPWDWEATLRWLWNVERNDTLDDGLEWLLERDFYSVR